MALVARSTVPAKPMTSRGEETREALLDAAEGLIADHGFRVPSHRMIAGEANAHAALVNYHFSSKELLFEATIERRAARLNEAWRNALNSVRIRASCKVEDILAAWWHPFGDLEEGRDLSWSNYLCVIARIASAAAGETWHQRYFGVIDCDFQTGLAEALPGTHRNDIEAGFRYSRSLFGEVLLHRCGKTGGTCRPRGFREDDIDRMICYLGSGMRGLARDLSMAAD